MTLGPLFSIKTVYSKLSQYLQMDIERKQIVPYVNK